MSSYKNTTLERIEFEDVNEDAPLLVDDWTLAFRLGFTGRALWYVIKKRQAQYKEFKIRKSSGGMRLIHSPSTIMRVMAKQIRARILLPLCEKLGAHVSAYQVGKSTRDSALQHLAPCAICAPHDGDHSCQAVLDDTNRVRKNNSAECAACQPVPAHACPRRGVKIHMDLKDFFLSTRRSWIRQYFQQVVGYNHYVSSLLATLMTVEYKDSRGRKLNGVPQGSLTSGDICNLVADWRLDSQLLPWLKQNGWAYTRYADDLYFSHVENLPREKVDETIREIERVIQRAGYRVNRKKLHVQRPHRRQKLLGIVLNQKLNMPKEEYRKFRALLHNCVQHGFESQVKKAGKKNVHELHNWLRGKLSYFSLVAPNKAAQLLLVYEAARNKHPALDDAPIFVTAPESATALEEKVA